MNYDELALEFLQAGYRYYKAQSQKKLTRAMHGEAFALQFIARNDDAVVPSDIENAMCVSSARIAMVLSSLENKGLISRRNDETDRRRVILKLTPAGEEKVAESTEELVALAKNILQYLGEEDAKSYVRIMGRLADMCKEDNERKILC